MYGRQENKCTPLDQNHNQNNIIFWLLIPQKFSSQDQKRNKILVMCDKIMSCHQNGKILVT